MQIRILSADAVRACVDMPAAIDAMSAAGAKAIGVPIRIVVGDRDELAPADANARILALHAPQAELRVL